MIRARIAIGDRYNIYNFDCVDFFQCLVYRCLLARYEICRASFCLSIPLGILYEAPKGDRNLSLILASVCRFFG
jgi:hypothetical protein